jgi:hypothetical protein
MFGKNDETYVSRRLASNNINNGILPNSLRFPIDNTLLL